jgi:hypothetical protein
MTVKCTANTTCKVNSDCTAQCAPIPAKPEPKKGTTALKSSPCETNPCAFTSCAEGSACKVNYKDCTASCIAKPVKPVPPKAPVLEKKCEVNPCAVMLCMEGTTCKVNKDCSGACVADKKLTPPRKIRPASAKNPAAAGSQCESNPCAAMLCKPGTTCKVKPDCSGTCVATKPVKSHIPAAPACDWDPCIATTCMVGSVCRVNRATCTGVCVPTKPLPVGPGEVPGSNPGGCEMNPCAAMLCMVGSTCVLNPTDCTAACVPANGTEGGDGGSTVCAEEDPCARVRCATGACKNVNCQAMCVAPEEEQPPPTPGKLFVGCQGVTGNCPTGGMSKFYINTEP